MANGIYNTPLMGTSMGVPATPTTLPTRMTTFSGTTTSTPPQVSTPMPNPMAPMMTTPQVSTVMPTVTQTPPMSTVMPNPMAQTMITPQVSTVMPALSTATKMQENVGSIISTNPQFFDVVVVDEDTPNLKEILTFSVYGSQYGITLYKDPKLNIVYAVDDDVKIYASEILLTRGSGLQNVRRDTSSQDQTIIRQLTQTYDNIGQPLTITDVMPSDQFGLNMDLYSVLDSSLPMNNLTPPPSIYQPQSFIGTELGMPINSFSSRQATNNQVFQNTDYIRQNTYTVNIPMNTYHSL